jgi:hypothetical protein
MEFLKARFRDFFFLLFINDLPNVISGISKPVLCADDTSIIIIFDTDSLKFKTKFHPVLHKINNWFQTNLLYLNFDKTNFLQFITKNSHELEMHVSYENKQIVNIYNFKFLSLSMDSSLSWKNHIDQLI